MPSSCQLCNDPIVGNIKNHLTPKSVINWIKDTSLTGHLREIENVNLRKQDTHKTLNFLCIKCESLISLYEKKFCEVIFKPYQEDHLNIDFQYSDWLLNFVTAQNWRVLKFHLNNGLDRRKKLLNYYLEAEKNWREYLLNKRKGTGPQEHYMIFLSFVKHSTVKLPKGFDFYINRSVDISIADDKNSFAFVFSKLANIVIVSQINPYKSKGLKSAKVHLKGQFKGPQEFKDCALMNFIISRATAYDNSKTKISTTQKQKIKSDGFKNYAHFNNQ